MRVQIINVEKDSSKVLPTGYCLLGEHKLYHEDGDHYGTEWIAGMTNLGEFLVGLESHENNIISFASSNGVKEDYIVWIGVEDNPY